MSTRPAALDSLTSIRGIAAWFVVLYHVRSGIGDYTPEALMAVFAKGYLAVDLFFMLSGFVLWLNYADRLRAGGLQSAPAFYWRRIARIWPLHAFILSGMVLFALVLAMRGAGDRALYPFAELPLHYAMVQNWGFTRALDWNDPAWSISCEFAAYLLFPLLALGADWRRVRVAGLVAGIVALAGLSWIVIDTPRLGDDIVGLGLWRCLIEFTMGTMLCALWQRCRQNRGAAKIAAAALLAAAAAWAAGLAETFVVPLLFAALLMLIALLDPLPLNPLRTRALVWLGDTSYATYLAHFPLFILFKLLVVSDPARIAPPLLLLFLVLVLLASALLYRWIEKPAQHALNRAWRGFRTTAPA